MGIVFYPHIQHPDLILVRTFKGEIHVENILGSWRQLVINDLIPTSVLGIINDLRGAQLKMSMEDFQKLLSFIRSNEKIRKLKLAAVCSNPENMVFPTLAEFREKDLNIRPFSMMEAAVDWIINER